MKNMKKYEEMTQEELFQEALQAARKNAAKLSEEEQAEFESIKEMVNSAISRGAPIKWHEEVFKDVLALHNNAGMLLPEMRKLFEDQIKLYDLVKSGVPFEDANKQIFGNRYDRG